MRYSAANSLYFNNIRGAAAHGTRAARASGPDGHAGRAHVRRLSALRAAGGKVLCGPHYVPPLDRTPLQRLFPLKGETTGEGTAVTLAGHVEKAHYSDVGEGEGVVCTAAESSATSAGA